MTQLKKEFPVLAAHDIPYILVSHHQNGRKDIDIQNLTVRTPGNNSRTLVENLDMTLTAGSRTVLTGASGSGKTLTAKAILGQYDYGKGIITMPNGVKVMSMSQHSYFPNTNLRGIMNARPVGKEIYKDEELTKALREVGLDQLIQQIPGQRIKLIMDELLAHASHALENSGTERMGIAESLKDELESLARQKVSAHFNTVQFTPDEYRAQFSAQLADLFKAHDISGDLGQQYGQSITDVIDLQLVAPLCEFLKQAAIRETMQGWGSTPSRIHNSLKSLTESFRSYANLKSEDTQNAFSRVIAAIDEHIAQPAETALAKKNSISDYQGWGHFLPHTPEKIGFLQWNMQRILTKKLKRYMSNEDTDDVAREIRLSTKQTAFIARHVPAELAKYLAERNAQSVTAATLSRATWPLSAKTLHGKAGRMARNLTQGLTAYMDHMILRGDNMTLSGGERQKLVIAMVLLHKPDVLILDEITAALDRPTALKLYKDMLDKIPADTTVLSIAHNEHIIPLHTHHAHLADKTIKIKKVEPDHARHELKPGLTI